VDWERLQPVLSWPLDATYLGQIQTAVTNCQNAGVSMLLDIHNYGRYNPRTSGSVAGSITSGSNIVTGTDTTGIYAGYNVSGTGIPGSTTVSSVDSPTQMTLSKNATLTQSTTVAWTSVSIVIGTAGGPTQDDYQNLMDRLAIAFPSATYPKLNIDMMNEPHGIDATVMANAYQAGITKLRADGFTGYILVEGTSFASCINWASSGWAAAALNITDMTAGGTPIAAGAPGYKIIDECHQYFDSDASGTHSTCTKIGATVFHGGSPSITDWARSNNHQLLLGEFGISTDPNCLAQYKDALDDMTANNDVWKGFTGWTDGAYSLSYMFNTSAASKTSTPTVNMPNTNLLISHRTLN
jgi:endoglucanase